MNLLTLIQRVQAETQHAVQTAAARTDVADVINAEYLALIASRRWDFRLRTRQLRVFADRTVDAQYSWNVFVGLTSRTLTLLSGGYWPLSALDALVIPLSVSVAAPPTTTTLPELESLRRLGRITGQFPAAWRTLFEQESRDYAFSDDTGFPDPSAESDSALEVYVDEPIAPAWAGTLSCILRRDRYQMPADCAEVMSVVSRDDQRGRVPMINRTLERDRLLSTNQDPPGPPQAFFMDDALSPPASPIRTLVGAAAAHGAETISITDGAHRYFYVRYNAGRMSGPSNIVSVTTSDQIVVLTVMDAEEVAAHPTTKLVFREDGASNRFYYVGTAAPNVATYTDSGALFPPGHDTAPTIVWSDELSSPRKAIRFWPRPDTDTWVEVQYLYQPSRMLANTDVPEMPNEFHELLVNLAVRALAARNGATSLVELHTKLAKEKIGQMESRYLSPSGEDGQREGWSPFAMRRGRSSKPVINWMG